ncbi:YggT family protein [bacterium]|nr:YggT family protein [candidate division CSSED10-310 bacterium]
MGLSVVQTIDILVNVMIIFFLMKTIIDPREFYFNSVLRPVDVLTEPVLSKLRKKIRPTRFGFDYTPILAILGLLILRVVSYWGLTDLGYAGAITQSVQILIVFLLRFFAFGVFVLLMIPSYMRNPLSSFLRQVVKPFEKPFSGKAGGSKSSTLIGALVLALFIGTILFTGMRSVQAESSLSYLVTWQSWLVSLLQLLIAVIGVYKFIIVLLIVAVIFSWVGAEIRNPVINLVFVLTEPLLMPIRRFMPPAGGLDLSPWIACIFVGVAGRLLTGLLIQLLRVVA